jgi:hypothetical protein
MEDMQAPADQVEGALDPHSGTVIVPFLTLTGDSGESRHIASRNVRETWDDLLAIRVKPPEKRVPAGEHHENTPLPSEPQCA